MHINECAHTHTHTDTNTQTHTHTHTDTHTHEYRHALRNKHITKTKKKHIQYRGGRYIGIGNYLPFYSRTGYLVY